MSIRKGKPYPYGIHVKDMKELCAEKPIVKMPAPPKVYICMSQHIGAPAIPIVNVGDKVLYSKYAGSTFKIDGEELTIIKQSDILAVVED